MAASRIDLVTRRVFNSGARLFGPISIPDNVIGLIFEVQRCTTLDPTLWLSPLSKVTIDTELSLDNGITWVYAGGIEAFGGIHIRQDLTEATDSYLRVDLPNGASRLFRGTASLTNGPQDMALSAVVDSVRVRDIVRPPRS